MDIIGPVDVVGNTSFESEFSHSLDVAMTYAGGSKRSDSCKVFRCSHESRRIAPKNDLRQTAHNLFTCRMSAH